MNNQDEILKCIIAVILGYMFAKYSGIGNGCNGFTPHVNSDINELNKAGCCVSNTAGYSVNPVAVSRATPGSATIGAFSNPCMPMN